MKLDPSGRTTDMSRNIDDNPGRTISGDSEQEFINLNVVVLL